jgi:Ni,Fe-hydrogenase III small subunit
VTDLGGIRDNFLIVSERVIDGSKQVFRETYDDVPDPKLVISTAVCPTATRFWDELPVGWASVGEVLPVDIAVAECINGNPESLMAAVLSHLTPRETNVSEAESNAAMSLGR